MDVPCHLHRRRKPFYLEPSIKLGQRQTGDNVGVTDHARRQQDAESTAAKENAHAQ